MAESQFGKFTLIRKIASGGMGEVFLARQQGREGFEKFLVVKRILSHHTENADYIDMFFAEARLAAKMSHSNIVQIFDMGDIDGSVYIAMEFVHGKSIKDIIDASRARGVPIPPAHVADVVGKLCSGMSYAHSLTDVSGQSFNIIHRDINPHNVLVSYSGEAKIIDFGIAKSEMNEHKTETGTIKGKFVYMSPEQSAAEKIDKRSDIFSIGIVLYEMLSGENPFQKANIVLSLDAIQRFTPPPPSSINPEFKAFDSIVAKALAKKPEDRYQDASEMHLALQRAVILGDIAPPAKTLGLYMTELFKESIEKEQKYMTDSRRDVTNASIGDMTPRPQRPPSGPVQMPEYTPPPTPLPIHQTGSRSGVTQIRRRRRKLVMSIVASILLAAAVSVALILLNVPGVTKPQTSTAVNVDEPKVPKFVEPTPSTGVVPTPPVASAPVVANNVEPPKPSAPAPTATPAPTPKDPIKPKAPDKGVKPVTGKHRGGGDVVVEPPSQPEVTIITPKNNEPEPPPRTTVTVTPSQPAEPKQQPKPVPAQPAPVAPAAAFGGYFLVNSTPLAAVAQNGAAMGLAQGAKIDVKGATGLIKVGDGGSPFQVTFNYRMTAAGVELSVDSAPWSILKKNGIAVGKTPRPGITADNKPLRFEFASPAVQGNMTVVIRYFPN